MAVTQELRETLHILLLPIADEIFEDACVDLELMLSEAGVDEADYGATIRTELDAWRLSGEPNGRLKAIVAAALDSSKTFDPRFAFHYFDLHHDLTTRNLLAFDDARGLLSHVGLIAYLLNTERMSCAQVALVLSARRGTFTYSWQQIRPIALKLGQMPELVLQDCIAASDRDGTLKERRFVDASPTEAIEILSEKASELGYQRNLSAALADFYCADAATPFEPAYSIILHANALTAEFYDHPPQAAAYEFRPRGGAIAWIQKELHPSYAASESAYLNNSKGAYAFDENWAWGRKQSHWKAAHALSSILQGLGEMPYAGRRELAGWIRQWLLRLETDAATARVSISPYDSEGAVTFLRNLAIRNSESLGVLEQRVLDFISSAAHPPSDGWVVRGRGDHVNASNTSRRKMGDVEYLRIETREIVAYEAHGGGLSDVYIEGHKNTLTGVVRARAAELIEIAQPEEWDVTIKYVAHELLHDSPGLTFVDDFPIKWKFATYEELVADASSSGSLDEDQLQAFEEFVSGAIDGPYVPNKVRSQFNELLVSTSAMTPPEATAGA